jgi:hypothetical protein
MVEWAVVSVLEWAVVSVVECGAMVGALSAQDSVADSTDFGAVSAVTFQGTALSSVSVSLTGLITARDGVIPTTVILTTVTPTRLIRIPTRIRTHLTPTGMRTAVRTRTPARKQMENRFI